MNLTKKLRIGILSVAGLAALAGCNQEREKPSGGDGDSTGQASGGGTASNASDGGSTTGDLVNNITDEELAAYKASPITLTFWSPIVGPDAGYFQDIVTNWNTNYGNWIRISSDPLEEEAHYTRILTSFTDQTTADICLIHKQRLARYEKTGKLRDMSSIIANAGIEESQYIDGAWDDGFINNKQIGLVADYLPTLLFYNKKLIPEGYTEEDILSDDFTYEKLCEMAQAGYVHHAVSSKRKYGFAFNYGYCEEPFITNLAGLGAEPVKADNPTTPLYNSDAAFQAVKAIESIPFTFKDGNKIASASGSDHRKVFKGGKALFTMDGLWSAESLVLHNNTVDTGIAFLPKVNASAQRLCYSDAHTFVTFTNKNVSDARDGAISLFLKYFTANTLHWCKSGKVAARKDVAANEEYKKLDWSFVSDKFASVVTPGKIYSYQTITSHAAETISTICEGKGNDGTTAYTDEEIKSMLNTSVEEAKNLVKQL